MLTKLLRSVGGVDKNKTVDFLCNRGASVIVIEERPQSRQSKRHQVSKAEVQKTVSKGAPTCYSGNGEKQMQCKKYTYMVISLDALLAVVENDEAVYTKMFLK